MKLVLKQKIERKGCEYRDKKGGGGGSIKTKIYRYVLFLALYTHRDCKYIFAQNTFWMNRDVVCTPVLLISVSRYKAMLQTLLEYMIIYTEYIIMLFIHSFSKPLNLFWGYGDWSLSTLTTDRITHSHVHHMGPWEETGASGGIPTGRARKLHTRTPIQESTPRLSHSEVSGWTTALPCRPVLQVKNSIQFWRTLGTIQTCGQFRVTGWPNLHVFGLWEETSSKRKY